MVAQEGRHVFSRNQLVSSWDQPGREGTGARMEIQPGTKAFSLITRHGSPFTVPPVLETAERLWEAKLIRALDSVRST